jgi:septum site-determining protein MinC
MSSLSHTIYTPAFELKGSLSTLMVLRLLDSHNERIAEQFAEKVAKAPHFFQNAPLVIDLYAVRNENVDMPYLVNLLRTAGLIPVAVRGGSELQHNLVLNMGLGWLPDAKSKDHPRRLVASEPTTVTPTSSPAKIITQPVRSGQQMVAMQGDLIVLAAVSHGAEILAQGHIHVYGALRGRALAGVNGDKEARIFCQSLEAELVSIAGQYQINEDLPDPLRGKSVQVYLENEQLKIEAIY